MRKYLYLLLAVACGCCWNAGKAQVSEGGTPPSFAYESTGQTLKSAAMLHISFKVEDLLAEDVVRKAEGKNPRIAQIIPINYSIENSGQWTELPGGQRIWRLSINAPEALATMLFYDEFTIPKGGKLFIYSKDRSKVLGAYTETTNAKGEEFATEMVPGEECILEYVEPLFSQLENSPAKTFNYNSPAAVAQPPRIVITGIGYVYGDEGVSLRARWESDACEVNVNCSEGDNWQNQKKGVARILTPASGSVFLCSGTVINNTAHDYDPLFLSAFHCYDGMSASQMNQATYYFHYEYEGCNNLYTDPTVPTITGATMLSQSNISGGSDGALVRLNQAIPANYDVYYNGWDRTNTAATSGVGIHHPSGDVKKISTFTTRAQSTTWNGANETGASGAHWYVIYAETANGHGVTEGGSSGSPLFNQDGLVVGSLTGGNSGCVVSKESAGLNGSNIYGKLWYHWDRSPSEAAHFNKYLDPENTGVETLQGSYQRPRKVRNLAGVYDREAALATITWEVPESTTVDKYLIYVAGVLEDSTTTLSYTYSNPEIGFTEYCVVVRNPEGETSEKACIEVCNPFSQTIVWDQLQTIGYTSDSVALTATVESGLPVTYVSLNETVAQVYGDKLIVRSLGTVDIVASQAGNVNYLPAADITRQFTISDGAITANDLYLAQGEELTAYATVDVFVSFSGGVPTEYKVGEQADLSDAEWQTYPSAITYTFASPKNEIKVVYAQLRNAEGETAIVSDSIMYKALHEKMSVTSFTVNNGETRTTKRQVTLNHTVANDVPTHYSVAENLALVGAQWNLYEEAPSYQLSEGQGQKNLYFMVANSVDTSNVVRNSIYLDEAETLQSKGLTAKLYPNPVKDLVNVQLEENISSVNVVVYSVLGEVYLSKAFSGNAFTIDLSKYPSGILLVRLSHGNSYTVKRLMKQ